MLLNDIKKVRFCLDILQKCNQGVVCKLIGGERLVVGEDEEALERVCEQTFGYNVDLPEQKELVN